MNIQEAFKQKESEIQEQLDKWVRRSGLFLTGDGVKLSLTLTVAPVVFTTGINQETTASPPATGYYEYFPLTSKDCEEILASDSLQEKWKKIVRVFQTNLCIPLGRLWVEETYGVQLGLRGSRLTGALRKSGLKFRATRLHWDKQQGEMVQLFRVEPKKPTKKHWE